MEAFLDPVGLSLLILPAPTPPHCTGVVERAFHSGVVGDIDVAFFLALLPLAGAEEAPNPHLSLAPAFLVLANGAGDFRVGITRACVDNDVARLRCAAGLGFDFRRLVILPM